jgi:hypothetical protein
MNLAVRQYRLDNRRPVTLLSKIQIVAVVQLLQVAVGFWIRRSSLVLVEQPLEH